MLIANVDTYEFGVTYNKRAFTPLVFLKTLNDYLDYSFETKVYYSNGNYTKEFHHLASKARIKSNDRFTFIAFLYIEHLDFHITVVQHSNAEYLTFKLYGLFQEKEESLKKSLFTFEFIEILLSHNFKIRNVKIDIAVDFNFDFTKLVSTFKPTFKKIDREPYVFKKGETVYFNSPLVNECLIDQKIYKEKLNCNQKNCYYNIIIYNKSLKSKLDYPLTRLEFSFKNVLNLPKLKYINNYDEVKILLDNLIKRIEKYLNKEFKIILQNYQDETRLNLKEVAINNVNYLQEKKAI